MKLNKLGKLAIGLAMYAVGAYLIAKADKHLQNSIDEAFNL